MAKGKKKGGKKKAEAVKPGEWPMGKSKEKTVEAELAQAKSRFISLQAEMVARNDEASRATAELRIATKKRDEARAQASGMDGDVVSVQRDFARLFKARQQTLIDQISNLEEQAAGLRERIEMTDMRTSDMAKSKDYVIGARDATIEEIKDQMRQQAQEFDEMMTTILDKLSKEILVSTAPKQLLNAGVPIADQLAQVNSDIQSRALE